MRHLSRRRVLLCSGLVVAVMSILIGPASAVTVHRATNDHYLCPLVAVPSHVVAGSPVPRPCPPLPRPIVPKPPFCSPVVNGPYQPHIMFPCVISGTGSGNPGSGPTGANPVPPVPTPAPPLKCLAMGVPVATDPGVPSPHISICAPCGTRHVSGTTGAQPMMACISPEAPQVTSSAIATSSVAIVKR